MKIYLKNDIELAFYIYYFNYFLLKYIIIQKFGIGKSFMFDKATFIWSKYGKHIDRSRKYLK